MILSTAEIIEIIKNPRNKDFLDIAVKTQRQHDRHVSGHDFDYLIKPLNGFEKEDQKRIKHQLAIPSTVSIVSEIKSVLNKWQSATDTNKNYQFDNKEEETFFKKEILAKVWKGDSMEHFVNFFLKNALWNKFNDFLIVNRSYITEKSIDGKLHKVEIIDGFENIGSEDTRPYIAHISIKSVHDFLIHGNKVAYLCFKFAEEKGICYYKFLDAKGVYTIEKEGSKEPVIINFVPNELKELTAVRVSSLASELFPNVATSLLEPAIYELDAFVNHYAIHEVSKILHAYPQRYSAGAKCTYEDEDLDSSNCNGTGKIVITEDNERKTITCPKCGGTGWNTVKDASQDFVVPFMLEDGEKPYSSSPVGYATIDIGILNFQSEQLESSELSIKSKILNKNTLLENSTVKTATEIIENSEPVVLLNMYFAKLIEFTEKKLTDWIGRYYSENKYKGCTINYGLNYANKNKEQYTLEIENAKKAGLSISEITELHKKRIKSANMNDTQKMMYQKLLFDLEPFNTLTIEQVEASNSILPIDKMKKMYFNEYIQELTDDNKLNLDFTNDYNKIIKNLKEQINQLNKKKYDSSKDTRIDTDEGRESV
jgi:hypothetical protein